MKSDPKKLMLIIYLTHTVGISQQVRLNFTILFICNEIILISFRFFKFKLTQRVTFALMEVVVMVPKARVVQINMLLR
jgi:hypothetical protein